MFLPAGFNNSGDLGFGCQFAEADAAKVKIAHITAGPPAAIASSHETGGEFRLSFRFGDL
ncbi:MAG: hypothetical protein A2846_00485 [Candidatus Doudnabacteria bacterium RIFCSPHIGHO2_01_FULL_49_9]|uniref:Uncharacterized protein n=1 Tax=Candidatus Doudnabacteria bacterium RIFCSPHIGHO2_01_FULL_49_9 TaxID=1817827 RepID=A0A1F5NY37_9BACT|nr:MAG: hypothetical protein A2846_00485 [Candidatus Doudnabacteria bacterium RIFCSPHIGHO2_01_FULL_49_9]